VSARQHCQFLALGLLILLLAACALDDSAIDKEGTPGDPTAGWYSIFYTDPTAPAADTYRGGPDAALAAALDEARVSIDLAVLEMNLWSVRDALIDAHRRGVRVRVVVDSDNLEDDEIQDLIEAGIPVLGDRREGLMHNKFTVIDRMEVWTGSMNYTTTDGYRNNNNMIHLRSSKIAEDYTTEFEEMFVDDLFGPDVRSATPYAEVKVDGTTVEIMFSPDDGVSERLVELLASAEQSIHFLAFSFTLNDLADVLLERASAGVKVSGVMDESQAESNTGGEYERFRSAGLDVYLDGNEYKMHHKVFIIDSKIVVTGSYNFSTSAETRNDENILILFDQEVARVFAEEFQRIFLAAER
jgi:phosphatidylserine/phosphatidylglycerophosphate/cardiolipin synthase-like enzyme